jgi:cobalamin biosynthesis protein CbiD
MEETRLLAGYVWDKDLRDVGAAIISLRDGQDNIVWAEVLAEVTDNLDAGDGATIVTPQQARPTPPTIEVAKGVGQTAKELAEEA